MTLRIRARVNHLQSNTHANTRPYWVPPAMVIDIEVKGRANFRPYISPVRQFMQNLSDPLFKSVVAEPRPHVHGIIKWGQQPIPTYMENQGYVAKIPPRQRQLSRASISSIVMTTSRVNNTKQNIINVQGFVINLNCHSQNKHPHAHQPHHHKNLPVTFVVAR
jgi:hypothetical protein